ncbi:MAG: 50S ribosomal protein L17 [Nitrospirae bacterium]|nr:50S ribosomal protein L17 [Candidatus Troglogloeales bacterium]MBI3598988.1 50S ribosomal protein L17 [Candidatus Troglogloeales bacterium]
MRHRTSGRQLGRNGSHRRALFRNLVTALLRHERIETTEAKGKEIRSIVDKMVTLGKQGDLSARRTVLAYLLDSKVAMRLFSEIAPLFAAVQGGYTRLIKTRIRYGDGAPMVIVELTKRTAPQPQDGSTKGTVAVEEKSIITPASQKTSSAPVTASAAA